MGKSGTHGIDMLIHWWGRFFGMAQWLQVKWHCMTLSLSMSHTPCVQGFCFQHVRMHLLIWQLRKYLQWSRKPGSNQCSEYTFCHQTIGKTSVCCLNGHHQKSGKHMSIRMIHWSNPVRCFLENFRFLTPVFIDSRGAVDTNCWQMLPVASEDFAVRFGSMFCRGEMLTWGYVAAITACARGQQWEETLHSDNSWWSMYIFLNFFQMIFFSKMTKFQIDFGSFGLQFFVVLEDVFLRPSVWISCPKHWIRAWNLSWLASTMLQVVIYKVIAPVVTPVTHLYGHC